jgi:hypothetical protein
MPQRLKDRNIFIAALACATPVLLCEAVWANNLAGLVYVVFIWPIGALCLVLLLVLCVISARRYIRRGEAGPAKLAPAIFLAVSAAVAVGYPPLVVMLDGAYQAGAPPGIMFLSIAPVELAALPVILMNLALVRR